MSTDGTPFLRRANALLARLKLGRPTTAQWLADDQEISVPTARRVITRLREEFRAPIVWDPKEDTWRLTRHDFGLPLPPLAQRAEVLALTWAVSLARDVADPALRRPLADLRNRLLATWRTNAEGLDRILDRFSCDRTELARLAEGAAVPVLEAVGRGRAVRFRYRSPWSLGPVRERVVTPVQLRQSDGALYLLGREGEAERVYNLAFAEDVEGSDPVPDVPPPPWEDSFGVWSGPGDRLVEVHVSPPASRYFARQTWHAGEEDEWRGDVLVRRLRAHPSPELLRRLLSLGDALAWVEPAEVRRMVRRAAVSLAGRLDREG